MVTLSILKILKMSKVLEILLMIRLKHILQYNLVLTIFVLITIIYVSYTYINPIKSKYDLETKSVQGYVLSYKIDGNELSIDLKGLEKIKVKYTFKTIDE